MSAPSPRSRRLFSFMGCLVAGPLGCLSFLGGGLAVSIFFAPEIGEKLLGKLVAEEYQSKINGELTVESIDLAWTSAQRFEGIELRDADGRVVLRGDLEIPPILAIFSDDLEFGVSTLRLEGDVHVDEEGIDNVRRALTRVDVDPVERDLSWDLPRLEQLLDGAFESNGSLVVEIRRLSWSAESGNSMRGVIAKDVRATVVARKGESLEVGVQGRLGWLNSSSESGAVTVRGNIEREAFFAPEQGGRPGVHGAIIAKGLPSELLALAAEPAELLRQELGDQFDLLFSIDPSAEGRAPFNATLNSEGLRGTARGELKSNGLLALESAPPQTEQLQLNVELEQFPEALVPSLLAALEVEQRHRGLVRFELERDQPLALAIEDLAWSRRGESHPSGEFALELPDTILRLEDERALKLFRPELSLGVGDGDGDERSAVLRGFLDEEERGEFSIDYASFGAEPQGEGDASAEAGALPSRTLTLTCRELPVARLDTSLRLGGQLRTALGSFADLALRYSSDGAESGDFSFELLSDQSNAAFAGTVLGVPTDLESWLAALDFTGEIRGGGSHLFAPFMPTGVRLDWDDALDIAYEGWRERDSLEAADDSAQPEPGGPVVTAPSGPLVGGGLTLWLPRLVYRDSDPDREIFELAMSEVDFFARGDSEVLRVDVLAQLDGGGKLEKHWTFYGLTGLFGREGHQDLRLRAESVAMPTLALDQRLGTDGLFADLFGESVNLVLTGGGLSAAGGRVQCRMQSERATLDLAGFRAGGEGLTDVELTLDFLLDPRSAARLVRPLLPFVVDFERAGEQPTRARVSLAKGWLPLDGDPAAISGRVTLDLAAVRPVYTERFESFLAEPLEVVEGEPTGWTDLEPIELQLASRRLECKRVVLPVHGHAAKFDGRFGLGGIDLDLQAELPLAVVGEKANLLLHGMRDSFQPNLLVPLVIRGATVAELDMSVRPQWVRTVQDILGQFVPEGLKDTMRGMLSEDQSEEPSEEAPADGSATGGGDDPSDGE